MNARHYELARVGRFELIAPGRFPDKVPVLAYLFEAEAMLFPPIFLVAERSTEICRFRSAVFPPLGAVGEQHRMVTGDAFLRSLKSINLVPDAIRSRPVIVIPADNDFAAREFRPEITFLADRAAWFNMDIADITVDQVGNVLAVGENQELLVCPGLASITLNRPRQPLPSVARQTKARHKRVRVAPPREA
jgi:hypothetical protein